MIALGPHQQPSARQLMLVKPRLRCRANPLGSTGEIDDFMRRRSMASEFDADVEYVVLISGGKKRGPVLRASGHIMEAVPHVGEYSVDIEDDEGRGHAPDTTEVERALQKRELSARSRQPRVD